MIYVSEKHTRRNSRDILGPVEGNCWESDFL